MRRKGSSARVQDPTPTLYLLPHATEHQEPADRLTDTDWLPRWGPWARCSACDGVSALRHDGDITRRGRWPACQEYDADLRRGCELHCCRGSADAPRTACGALRL